MFTWIKIFALFFENSLVDILRPGHKILGVQLLFLLH